MTAAVTPSREALRGEIAQAICCHGDCIRGADACWKYTTSGHKKITDAIVDIFDRLAAKPADEGWKKALRRLAIVQCHQMTYGGGTIHVGWHCKSCDSEWGRVEREKHQPECFAALSTTGDPER